jgi:hypothetical protein
MENVIVYSYKSENCHSSLKYLEIVIVHLFVQPLTSFFIYSVFFIWLIFHEPLVEMIDLSYVISVGLKVSWFEFFVVNHWHFVNFGVDEIENSTYEHYKF